MKTPKQLTELVDFKTKKRLMELAGINESSHFLQKLANMIRRDFPEIVESGEIESGTEEWLDLLTLVINDLFVEINDPYEILINTDIPNHIKQYFDNFINERDPQSPNVESKFTWEDVREIYHLGDLFWDAEEEIGISQERAKQLFIGYLFNKEDMPWEESPAYYLNNALDMLGIEII